MNWTGLLNWSLQYTDGTRPSEFKPMDEETKQWLKEALDSMIVDDTAVLKNGCKILSEQEIGSEEERVNKENAADLVLSVIENLDMGLNLVKINGLKDIVHCMIGSQYPSVRKLCASIFTSAVQNNPPVQRKAIEEHALEGLYSIILVEEDLRLKEQYVSCLSGIVRGDLPLGRENLVKIGGLEVIKQLILNFESPRIVKKCLLMVSDMLHGSSEEGVSVLGPCKEIGLIDIIAQLVNNQDPEIVEMAQWAIHNSLISTQ